MKQIYPSLSAVSREVSECRRDDTGSRWHRRCLRMPRPASFTVARGGFESGKLFPSRLICSSYQQRQLTLDKHYLHNARHNHDHNKGVSSHFPVPPLAKQLFVCEAVAGVWEREPRSDGGAWSFDSANNKPGGFERSVQTPRSWPLICLLAINWEPVHVGCEGKERKS